MKKMLMITIELPFPVSSGGRMKSWNLVKFLSQHYELGLASVLKYGVEHLSEFRDRSRLREFVHERVEIPRSPQALLASYLAGVPLNVYRSRSRVLQRRIADIADDYDVLLLDHYESFQYLPKNYRGQVIFHAHNATYLMWERYATSGANPVFRAATGMEARRVRAHERRVCERADRVFAAPNDIDKLSALGVEREKFRTTYHLGDDSQLSLPDLSFDATELSLISVGTLNWEPNVDGLLWFFETVWPSLSRRHPQLRFHIVGAKPDPRLTAAANSLDGIDFTGFVDDLEPLLRKSRVFVAPLRFGSGIKVKVLNAMCRGLPTVTTSIGAEGIDAQNGRHLAICDTPQASIAAIERLLSDRDAWQTLERESRALIRAKYTWEKVLGHMVDEINLSLKESGDAESAAGAYCHP